MAPFVQERLLSLYVAPTTYFGGKSAATHLQLCHTGGGESYAFVVTRRENYIRTPVVLDLASKIDVIQDQPREPRVTHVDGYRHLDSRVPDIRKGGIDDGGRAGDLSVRVVVQPEADLSAVHCDALPNPTPVPDYLYCGIAAVEGQSRRAKLLAAAV